MFLLSLSLSFCISTLTRVSCVSPLIYQQHCCAVQHQQQTAMGHRILDYIKQHWPKCIQYTVSIISSWFSIIQFILSETFWRNEDKKKKKKTWTQTRVCIAFRKIGALIETGFDFPLVVAFLFLFSFFLS